jgi:hypothetical protein
MAQQQHQTEASAIEQAQHAALPNWYAAFQKTFGLSFLILCSAYLMGKLATLGWVPDLGTPFGPHGWGWVNGVGVVLFFLGGVTIAGIALTCSVSFVRAVSVKPRQPILALFTFLGMLIFFGIEVWASLSERSLYLVATPADKAVLSAFGFHGTPPISPTVLVVSLMFPLGMLYYGFVQQGRQHTSAADLAEDAAAQQRQLQAEQYKARMAEAKARTQAARARGLVGTLRAGVDAARHGDEDEMSSQNGHVLSPPDFP